MKIKQQEYIQELAAVYKTIDELKKIIDERDIRINMIVKQNGESKVAATALSKAHSDIINKFVKENLEEPQWKVADAKIVEN